MNLGTNLGELAVQSVSMYVPNAAQPREFREDWEYEVSFDRTRRFENRTRRLSRCWVCLSMSVDSILWSMFGQNDNEEEVWTNTELARLLPLAPRKCASAVVAPRSNAFISSILLTLLPLTLLLTLLLLLPTEEHCWRSWSRNLGVNCILATDALEGQSRCNNLTMLWTKCQWSPGWLVLSWSLWSLLCANSLLSVCTSLEANSWSYHWISFCTKECSLCKSNVRIV